MIDSSIETNEHIKKVAEYLHIFAAELERRAACHDASKLEEPEKSAFDLMKTKAKAENLVYGSPEYKAALQELAPALAHHYAHNSHHPEHYPNGIYDMNLFDIVEMFVDWKAASEIYKDGSIIKSIGINTGRFGISDQLALILANTVDAMGWGFDPTADSK